ncbi:hypothetical protein LTR70_005222 [Exophiala xenobiotica]|uniref:Solute carrier family 40 member n=1 Tax=Lithohypha guttulata TaxID=1690604 RepID=A0ABR0KB01_9EURO|nr:hypothetical protein LTR24_004709 [Lithohypha guttulata]KAK5318926.1 hypothetical protein LTR70_005222 [Exophiala xenobiotica]
MTTASMQYARLDVDDNDGRNDPPEAAPSSRSLYISHFISTWNSRGFEFGAVLFLSTIYPGTLLPMSIYALCRALAAVILSPAVGKHIDSGDRLSVIRLSILGQRLAVAASCAAFLTLLTLKEALPTTAAYVLFTALLLLACIEKMCIIMNTIAVERDWVVVITADDERLLQEMNAQMRRIDLFCKLVSPLAIALLDGLSSKIAIITTLALNSTTVIAEYFLIAWVYRRTPALSKPAACRPSETLGNGQDTSTRALFSGMLKAVLKQAELYGNSHAFLPSLSLSLLFFTVLSFSGQMITYLFATDYPRLTSIHVGILRTIATVLEISSTFITPLLISRIGVVRTGIWSLSWQCLCLTPGVATFWFGPPLSPVFTTYLFIACVILSRIGLWSFDLTAQLLVQNSTDASQRGSFSAAESSLQNFFELCTFAMTIIWSEPEQFRYPATISLAALYTAAACYARFARVERGHLLHMPLCCGPVGGYKAVRTDEEGEELQAVAS